MRLIFIIFILLSGLAAASPYTPRYKVNIEELIKAGKVRIDWYQFHVEIDVSKTLTKEDYKFLDNGKVLAKRQARWLFDDILAELVKKMFKNPVIIMDRFYEQNNQFNATLKKFLSHEFQMVHHDLVWRTDGYINCSFTGRVRFYGENGILYNFYPVIVPYIQKYKRLFGTVTALRDNTFYYHNKKEVYSYHKTIDFPEAITALFVKLNGMKFNKTLIPVIAGVGDRIIFGYNDLDMKECRYRPCPTYCRDEKEAYYQEWAGENAYIVNAVKVEKNTIYIPEKESERLNIYFQNYPEVIRKAYICIIE